MEIKGYITNLGKYNEGYLVGKWVTFPLDEEEEEKVLEEIGINDEYEEYFITDYDCDVSSDSLGLGEYTSISHINEIAEAINEWGDDEFSDSVIEIFGIDAILNDSPNDYILYPDISNHYDLGYYWVEESGVYDLRNLGNLANYIDYESFGRDISLESNGGFSSYGWVEKY